MSSWFPPPRLRAVAFAVAASVLLAAAAAALGYTARNATTSAPV